MHAADHSLAPESSSSSAAWPRRPGSSPNASTLTSCGTRSQRTCSKEARTCAPSRRCSGTRIWRRRSSIRTYPIAGGASCTSKRTRMRAGRSTQRNPGSRHAPRPARRNRRGQHPRSRVAHGQGRSSEERSRTPAAPARLPLLRQRDPRPRLHDLRVLALRLSLPLQALGDGSGRPA